MRIPIAALCLLLATAPSTRATDTAPPAGSYTNTQDEYSMTVSRSGDSFTVVFTIDDETYRVKGTLQADNTVRGVYIEDDERLLWSLVMSDAMLILEVEDEQFTFTVPNTTPTPPATSPTAPAPTTPTMTAPTPAAPAMPPATATPPSPGTLKFTRLAIHDPQMNNVEAVSLLVPEGWHHQGGVQWFHDHSILANVLLTITDPQTGAQMQFLPIQNFTHIDQPPMPMQVGQNYMGNIVCPPITDIPEFINQFYAPQTLPHLQTAPRTSVTDLPQVAAKCAQDWGGGEGRAAKVRYQFDHNGAAWTEEITVCLVYLRNANYGMTSWSVYTAHAFRAPSEHFDRLLPVAGASFNSVRLGQDWFSGYAHVKQLFRNRMWQGIQDSVAFAKKYRETQEEIRQMYADAYKQRTESQERISREYGKMLSGVEHYTNPYEQRPVELPSGYKEVWVSPQGQYILSEQTGYDPNVGSTLEWRRMDVAPN